VSLTARVLAELFGYVLTFTAVVIDIVSHVDESAAECIKDDECFCRWMETMVEELSLNHEEETVEVLRRFMKKCFG